MCALSPFLGDRIWNAPWKKMENSTMFYRVPCTRVSTQVCLTSILVAFGARTLVWRSIFPNVFPHHSKSNILHPTAYSLSIDRTDRSPSSTVSTIPVLVGKLDFDTITAAVGSSEEAKNQRTGFWPFLGRSRFLISTLLFALLAGFFGKSGSFGPRATNLLNKGRNRPAIRNFTGKFCVSTRKLSKTSWGRFYCKSASNPPIKSNPSRYLHDRLSSLVGYAEKSHKCQIKKSLKLPKIRVFVNFHFQNSLYVFPEKSRDRADFRTN